MNDYSKIFNQRGKEYHEANSLIPWARKKEFGAILDGLEFRPGQLVIDMPSGGGYLQQYLPEGIGYRGLEVSEVFAKAGSGTLCSWSKLPLQPESSDFVLVCAAFHHVSLQDRQAFCQEVHRCLKTGGILRIADVQTGEPNARFLNGFVDEHNPNGHRGDFIDEYLYGPIETYGFALDDNRFSAYTWEMDVCLEKSLRFVRLLFGLTLASDEDLENELQKSLGLRKNEEGRWIIDWSLRVVTLRKQ